MKYLFITFLILFAHTSFATEPPADPYAYVPLVDIPGITSSSTQVGDLGTYLSNAYTTVISIAIALAVLMFIWHGFKYLMSETGFVAKKAATEGLQNVIIGLLIIFGSFLLLRSINPALVNLKFGLSGEALQKPELGVIDPYNFGLPGTCTYENAKAGFPETRFSESGPGVYLRKPINSCVNPDKSRSIIFGYSTVGSPGDVSTDNINACWKLAKASTINNSGNTEENKDQTGVRDGLYTCITIFDQEGVDITTPTCTNITKPSSPGLYMVETKPCKNNEGKVQTQKIYVSAGENACPSTTWPCERWANRFRYMSYNSNSKKYEPITPGYPLVSQSECSSTERSYRASAALGTLTNNVKTGAVIGTVIPVAGTLGGAIVGTVVGLGEASVNLIVTDYGYCEQVFIQIPV